MPWPPQRVPGAAGPTPPRVEPALRSTRCSVNIRSTGEATAAAAVACVRWDAGYRACRVLVTARFYLYQPEDLLLRILASELAQLATPPPSTEAPPDPGRAPGAVLGDPDATDVLPRIS